MTIKGWIGIGVFISTGIGAILGLIKGKYEEKELMKRMEDARKEIELAKMIFEEIRKNDKQTTEKKEDVPKAKEITVKEFFKESEYEVSETKRRTMDEFLGKKEENEHLRKSREIMEKMDYVSPEDRVQMLKDALEETKKALGDLYGDNPAMGAA